MNQHLSSLLLGLLFVATTACSEKKEPEPVPSLEGTWMLTRLTEHIPCSNCPTQRFVRDEGYAAGVHTLTITANEYTVRDMVQNTTYAYSYVRRGDTLVITSPLSGSITSRPNIVELKARSLHLQRYVATYGGTTASIDQYFTR
jgi:hypothetical protein